MSRLTFTVAIAVALSGHLCFAQTMLSSAEGIANETPLATVASVSVASPTAPKASLTGRWLDLTTFSHAERYRNAFASGGYHVFDNAQARSLIQGTVKLDPQGRYGVGFRASSGRYFNWAYGSYSGTTFIDRVEAPGLGSTFFSGPQGLPEFFNSIFADPAGFDVVNHHLNSNGWQFYMRELYVSATPVKAVTVEAGFIGIERGLSTEITTFDEDGYLTGERVRVHDPKHLYLDEISFTSAFFGDYDKPNLFVRGASLKKANYAQIAVKKALSRRIGVSGEYSRQMHMDSLREAARFGVSETKAFDTVRVELYQRVNAITFPGMADSYIGPIAPITVKGGSGFAVAVEKKWRRLNGDAGYASVDEDYAVYAGSRAFHAAAFSLNGDTYGAGKRPFLHGSFHLSPEVTVFGFYTHAVGAKVTNLNQQGYNAGVSFDLKGLINAHKAVF